ncbi:unnamed protein product [Ambrosiozyma monospora]|uniref:Unnamed protein product n=1 Tax=Ambrosiozyma monospora TaxID=43982 RepID=A0A9W6Z5N3_AMBMO|nr:unnamed protein product [Ambrosiozyma monospora]
MMDSGVDEFPMIDPKYIDEALKIVKGENTMIMFHAEMDSANDSCCTNVGGESNKKEKHEHEHNHEEKLKSTDPRAYTSFLESRPDSFEKNAISHIIACLEKQPTTPVHIVHLASQEAIPMIQKAKFEKNLPLSVETCFHYLTIKSEDIPDGATQFKCCPPIRTDENRKQLWSALKDGTITSVVSDHSPCVPELKGLDKGDFFQAWGGITSVGLGLPLLYTEGSTNFKVDLVDIAKWCCENTAAQVGLGHQKGKIAPGYDADFAIFDDNTDYEIANARTYFKNKLTAHSGKKMKGRVIETILRGNSIYAFGKGVSDVPMGKLILEPRQN